MTQMKGRASSLPNEETRLSVTIPLANVPQNAKYFCRLQEHGCEIVHDENIEYSAGEKTYTGQTRVIFPPGTTRRHTFTLQLSDLFTITLPSGLMLTEQHMFGWPISRL